MKNNNKTHVSFWLDKNDLKECDAMAEATNCRSRSEYIADAVRFYNGYNHDKNNEEYINTKVINSLKKMMTNFENRLGRAMFKQAVEMAKIFWLTCKVYDINPDDCDLFHEDCVQEVKRINGVIEFPRSKRRNDDEEYKRYRPTHPEKDAFYDLDD